MQESTGFRLQTIDQKMKMKQQLWRNLVIGAAFVWIAHTASAQVYISHTVSQPAALVVSAGPDQSACTGDSVLLGGLPSAQGGSGSYTYNWQPPTGVSDPTSANPAAAPSGTQAYTLTVSDGNGCTNTDQVTVTAANINANFVFSTNLLQASFTNATVGASSYLWDFGDGLTSTFANPSHTYANPGAYNVCLIANPGGPCQDSICSTVTVSLVGITPARQGVLVVYPNPAVGSDLHFALRELSLTEPVQIRLYDAVGRLVRTYEGPAAQEIHTIRRNGLAKGSYSYQLRSGEGLVFEGKIILE